MTDEHTCYGVDASPLLAIKTLSGLVEAIVDAGAKLDRDLYLPYASDWHIPDDELKRCRVCDAGAVLATLCKLPAETRIGSMATMDEFDQRLCAMDYIRHGEYETAAEAIELDIPNNACIALCKIDPPLHSDWSSQVLSWRTPEGIAHIWEMFDLHIYDLRDRVLPALQALDL